MHAPAETAYPPDASTLFRLPWNLADNAMTWLEPTRQCNITCDACFVENAVNSHKPLEYIESELRTLLTLRKCDAMLIAGGEPLIHPRVLDIVNLVKSFRVKPILITNGIVLDRNLTIELKKAGLFGITFHVDSHQSRPEWEGKSEKELNELRRYYADLLYDVSGLSCAFNTTIFPDTLESVPDILRWTISYARRVHIMTFICVRFAELDGRFEYFAGGKKIDLTKMPYVSYVKSRTLMTADIYREIKAVLPDMEFCAYLGGTAIPHSLKWVIGTHLVCDGESIGHLGHRAMELIQNISHFVRGRYLAYSAPSSVRKGKLSLLLAVIDPDVRRALWRFLRMLAARPARMVQPLSIQSLSVVQPVDILENGSQDNCDGCPNKTLWNGELISACRLEEYRYYGGAIISVPKPSKHFSRELDVS